MKVTCQCQQKSHISSFFLPRQCWNTLPAWIVLNGQPHIGRQALLSSPSHLSVGFFGQFSCWCQALSARFYSGICPSASLTVCVCLPGQFFFSFNVSLVNHSLGHSCQLCAMVAFPVENKKRGNLLNMRTFNSGLASGCTILRDWQAHCWYQQILFIALLLFRFNWFCFSYHTDHNLWMTHSQPGWAREPTISVMVQLLFTNRFLSRRHLLTCFKNKVWIPFWGSYPASFLGRQKAYFICFTSHHRWST